MLTDLHAKSRHPAERSAEAQLFFDAFAHAAARDFTAAAMSANYAEAVMTHHPDRASLDAGAIAAACERLVSNVFGAIDRLGGAPDQLFPLFREYSRANPHRSEIWFPEFMEAYQSYKHCHKLQSRFEKLKPYLNGRSYCDVGCGGGDLVCCLKQRHPAFNTVAGIDILDWRTEAINDEIGFQKLDFTRPGTRSGSRYDTLTCLAVIHHAGNTPQQIGTFLEGLRSAASPGGTVIVEEDVMIAPAEAAALGLGGRLERLKDSQPLFRAFVAFDQAAQKSVLTLTDFLANALAVGVPEMPFPCGFQGLRGWTTAFEEHGFSIKEIKLHGFVRGNFNQSSHAWFILENAAPAI